MTDLPQNDDMPTLSHEGGGSAGELPTVSNSGSQVHTDELRPQIEGYEILDLLGRGGMGSVWRAVQLGTKNNVAIKILPGGQFRSQDLRIRFEREVELSARLVHPNIVRVYDSGLHHGVYYYAMELIEGLPLDQYVEQQKLNQSQILSLMRTVALAVQHAHQRGVIHRDIKPSNILVTADGQPHVLDFGLAKAFLDGEVSLTISQNGEVAGTPAYMSPEQAAGRLDEIDTRSDVYSLGVMLYRLLTGKSPHDLTGTRYEVLRRIAEDEVRRPSEVVKRIDRELESLLLKALAQRPQDRYASATDLAEDLGNYLRGDPLIAKNPTPLYFFRKWVQKHRIAVLIACGIFVAATAASIWGYVRLLEQKTRHERYVEFRDAGCSILKDGNFSRAGEALAALENALKYEDDSSIRDLISQVKEDRKQYELQQDDIRKKTAASLARDKALASVAAARKAGANTDSGWAKEAMEEAQNMFEQGQFVAASGLWNRSASRYSTVCKSIELRDAGRKIVDANDPSRYGEAIALMEESLKLEADSSTKALVEKVKEAKANYEAEKNKIRKREEEFARFVASAEEILKKLPFDPAKATDAQQKQALDASRAILSALIYKPTDPVALNIKTKIDQYLKFVSDAEKAKEAKAKYEAERAEIERREAEYTRLLTSAEETFKKLPSDPTKSTDNERKQASDTLQTIQAVLTENPSNPRAVTLQDQITQYLKSASDFESDRARRLLNKGLDLYKSFRYTDAKKSLLEIASSDSKKALSASEQQTLDTAISMIDDSIIQQDAANKAMALGQDAIKMGDYVTAKEKFTVVAQSNYVEDATRQIAREQLAQIEERSKKPLAPQPSSPPKATPTKKTGLNSVPADLDSLAKMPPPGKPGSYPPHTITLFNLQRTLDPDLPVAERTDSMKVVTKVGCDDASIRGDLASVLVDPNAPPDLQNAILEFLIARDYPDLAVYVVKALPTLQKGPMRESVMDWLGKHGNSPSVLSEVVKCWAEEPSITGPNEMRYRQVIEKITSRNWDQALFNGINTEVFHSRGSALEILARRLPSSSIRQQIRATQSKSEAFVALRVFLDAFDYIPANASEFLAVASIYRTQPHLIGDAARLSSEWKKASGYVFNIRDFHLLSRLVRDALRKDQNMRRQELVLELTRTLKTREHVKHKPSAAGAIDDYNDQFVYQAENLTHADLWNLRLLTAMLSRDRVQDSLYVMAARDRADTRSAWGGLMFYRSGQAECVLYPASHEHGDNDLVYVPTQTAIIEGLDSLGRFIAHFEKVNNADRAGPNDGELRDSRAGNYYGLALTSLSEKSFCAHYFSPRGVVVSLGVFPSNNTDSADVPSTPITSQAPSRPVTKPISQPSSWPTEVKDTIDPQDAAAKSLKIAKEIALDLGNNANMKLILIPSGKFLMGSPETEKGREVNEGPQQQVMITKPFYMGVNPVTQTQWKTLMGTEPWKGQNFVREGEDCPTIYVNWEDATEFCKKLSQKTGKTVKLPTEAQWEYACRAGTSTRFYYGDDDDYAMLADYTWYDRNKVSLVHPVGQKKPNAFGLYDMQGNVWQWCTDWYGFYTNVKKIDPQGPDSGEYRVTRGGAWYQYPQRCRSAFRHYVPLKDGKGFGYGFRVILELETSAASAPTTFSSGSAVKIADAESVRKELTTQPTYQSGSGFMPANCGWPFDSNDANRRQIEAAKTLKIDKEISVDLGDGVNMKLILIPAGKFIMGSPESEKGRGEFEGPQHQVTLSEPFYMGIYQVTRPQWKAVMNTEPWKGQPFMKEGDEYPVTYVNWQDAVDFCKVLTQKTGKTVKLPTEAQWEYACRAGTATRFYYGDDEDYSKLKDYAWFGNGKENEVNPVGKKKPNAFGLYDMQGNPWQWCTDWYGWYPKTSCTDPLGPGSGKYRVLRGGSWYPYSERCRSAYRYAFESERGQGRCFDFGFRIIIEPKTPATEQGQPPVMVGMSVDANDAILCQQEAAKTLKIDKEITLDAGKDVSMKFALIPAGKFLMGSPETEKERFSNEGPQHEVTISKPFYMSVYAVTQEQWTAVMGTTPWKNLEYTKEGVNNAAACMNWDDAVEFCKKLSTKTGKTVKLPTEAQWEYACRAGSTTRFYYGDDENYGRLGDHAWYKNNASDVNNKYAHIVGQKKPNAWGLYDMHGNVFQWCVDWYGAYGRGKETDPTGSASGTFRVLRGGSWHSYPQHCRSAYRLWSGPGYRDRSLGFRIVLDLK